MKRQSKKKDNNYISFDEFKSSKKKYDKKWRCPICHKYVSDTVKGIDGKRICVDCFIKEEQDAD